MDTRITIPFILIFSLFALKSTAGGRAVVVDSSLRVPLPNASVYDRFGKTAGFTDGQGRMPYVAPESYPLTLRYLGFKDMRLCHPGHDTIFMVENAAELPEITVESNRHKVMHILAYVREYSTLSTYTDSVFLFREKMVDYMIVPDRKIKFKGWTTPRVLSCRSYYRFTDSNGLDSVSDESDYHFSWSDWIGLPPVTEVPLSLRHNIHSSDTVRGKYSPAEIWRRDNDHTAIEVNVLADAGTRKWVPDLSAFFRKDLDFENFRIKFLYNDVDGTSVTPLDLDRYSYDIESNGRGLHMFRFNRVDEPFTVSTSASIYILDKEYIPVKEARKWENRKLNLDNIGIYAPLDAPEMGADILALMERVKRIDKGEIRLTTAPDSRLAEGAPNPDNFKIGRRALFLLKNLCGITSYKYHKNINSHWNDFRDSRRSRNASRQTSDETPETTRQTKK